MADTTAVASDATFPTSNDLERVQALTREPFVLARETLESALAPGTPRRTAFDAALAEADAGQRTPSIAWRRDWALLLGLERLLSEEEPTLVDGTLLNAHQVDALSGTLTALLAAAQRTGGAGAVAVESEADVEELPSVEVEIEGDDDADEEPQDWAEAAAADDESQLPEQAEDPNAHKRFWFEHATGAGKSVAALGFVEACRTGGVLILTHRRNLVDQFLGELRDRGYKDRIRGPLLRGDDGISVKHGGPVTVETYQWFVRNAGNVSEAYQIVICDEAHTALGDKTSAAIRKWAEPIFVGMTATGALIARHVTDLFPTQTSRFDLAQAARRGVIAPLRCVRIPPGAGVRNIAKVPLRKGEVDVEFDQELLAEMLDVLPFNLAIADLYKTRFNGVPGVVYAAGVKHAYNVAEAFRQLGMKAQAVSGETPKRELAQILADYESGEIDVLVNAQLLAEGWNSPRATVCMHLAPTASKRIYQQRVGRVTRRHPGKEAGIVVDFVHPATKHDDPVVTLHSLLGRDVYRGGAIVVGPVRRGRGRRLRVERRVLPVAADEDRRIEVFERELWRIAVEHLDYGEQVQWAALAGARVAPTGWRRARAMLHFDASGELKRRFLTTALQRNKSPQLRLRALAEIAQARDDEAFDDAVDTVGTWPRDEKREGVKTLLLALAERKLGKREQANNWIWRCAEYTREYHEEYAVQRWPETKRLLGLLVNSSGAAHARNARKLVQATRDKDRRLAAAVLAAALPHTAEAGEVVNGARMRMSRKPGALARELLRNLPKAGGKAKRRRKKKGGTDDAGAAEPESVAAGVVDADPEPRKPTRRSRRRRGAGSARAAAASAARASEAPTAVEGEVAAVAVDDDAPAKPRRRRSAPAAPAAPPDGEPPKLPSKPARATRRKPAAERARSTAAAAAAAAEPAPDAAEAAPAKPARRSTTKAAAAEASAPEGDAAAPTKTTRRRTTKAAAAEASAPEGDAAAAAKPARRRTTKAASVEASAPEGDAPAPAKPARRRATKAAPADAPHKPARRRATKAAPKPDDEAEAA